MECKHYKGSGFHYDLENGEEIWLCEDCNRNLAMGIMEQAMLTVFMPKFIEKDVWEDDIK